MDNDGLDRIVVGKLLELLDDLLGRDDHAVQIDHRQSSIRSPENDSSSRLLKLKYTSVNTATTNSVNSPPPTKNHTQIRERPSAIIRRV